MIRSNLKFVATPLCLLGGLVLLIGALGVGTAGAGAQLAPGGAIIFLSSESKAGATTDTKTASAPGFADWTGVVNSFAADEEHGIYASGQKTLLTGLTSRAARDGRTPPPSTPRPPRTRRASCCRTVRLPRRRHRAGWSRAGTADG
jgi:hypothetical protein